MTKEQIYDEQINPLMRQIIAICKEHRINTHATFFLDDDLMCSTHLKLDGDPLPLEIMYLATACRSNIDLLFITLGRYVHEGRYRNESSAVLGVLADRQQTAGRCVEMLETEGVMLSILPGETRNDRVIRYAKAMAQKIRREFGLQTSDSAVSGHTEIRRNNESANGE